jgi:hypothetical protein
MKACVISGRPHRDTCTSGACPHSDTVIHARTVAAGSPINGVGTSITMAVTLRFWK